MKGYKIKKEDNVRKRFLGIPVGVIIALGLVLLLIGVAGAAGLLVMERDISSTVVIVGAGAEVYSDPECTTVLTTLDFGAIEAGGVTDPLTFYVENDSDEGYDIYLALSQTDLNPLLTLYEGEANLVPAHPLNLSVVTGTRSVDGYWTETGITTTLITEVDATATDHLLIMSMAAAPLTDGVVKIDAELILYGEYIGSPSPRMLNLQRGYDDTTPTTHSVGAIVTLMERIESPDEDLYNLAPGAVLPVTVYLEADAGIERGGYPFILTIEAQD